MEEKQGSTLWRAVGKGAEILGNVSGVAVTFTMVLTVLDVLGRALKHPILGSYEVIALSGALIVGFSMPFATASGSHVFMGFLTSKLPEAVAKVMNIATRVLCIVLFSVAGVNVFRFAAELASSGEVSPTLKVPIYPFAYLFGICCFLQCLVFVFNILCHFEREGGNR